MPIDGQDIPTLVFCWPIKSGFLIKEDLNSRVTLLPSPFHPPLQLGMLQMIHEENPHIYAGSRRRVGKGLRQVGNFVWKSIFCGSHCIMDIQAREIPERN